jgi:hypothetical protein
MREAYAHQEKAYEYLVDYIEQLSQMAEDDPLAVRKKLLASLLAEHHKRKPKKYRLSAPSAPLLSKQVATAYYTTTEVAKKFAHALQEVAAMAYLIDKRLDPQTAYAIVESWELNETFY